MIPCFSLMDKISSLLTYLDKVNDEDIICSTDGYDVLYVQSADQVMTSFLGFKTEILISGECYCSHHFPETKKYFQKLHKKTTYPYLCSGLIIGYALALKSMLKEMLSWNWYSLEQEFNKYQNIGSFNDQTLFGLYFTKPNNRIEIDTEGKLFWTMTKARFDIDEHVSFESQLKNNINNTFPGIIHVPYIRKYYPAFIYIAYKLGLKISNNNIDFDLLFSHYTQEVPNIDKHVLKLHPDLLKELKKNPCFLFLISRRIINNFYVCARKWQGLQRRRLISLIFFLKNDRLLSSGFSRLLKLESVFLRIVYANQLNKIKLQYINLDSRLDRRDYIERQLNYYKLYYRRVSASSYNLTNTISNHEQRILERGIEPYVIKNGNLGIIGCYMSHIRAIENIKPLTSTIYLNIEDDLEIRSIKFFTTIIKKIKRAPKDWDILLADSCFNPKHEDLIGDGFYKTSAPYPVYAGTHTVIINAKHKQKILDILASNTIKEIDKRLLHYDLGLNTYAFQTGYARQNKKFESDINSN